MKYLLTLIFLCVVHTAPAYATIQALDFTFHKLTGAQPGHTLLVVGGIQGDEPGGFNAASLLVTHYHIQKGNVWVVPNLNFISIINRSRGIHGDLNRKFAAIPGDDPEYGAIQKIKSIILDTQVDMVLNLHDGSGFYHPEHQDDFRNPNRWGQCVIIDQERIDSDRFGNLADIAQRVTHHVNGQLMDASHLLRVKNTNTRQGNTEMAKTLTYFAATHLKPAFGLEASKAFPTHTRAYYHIRALEAFMDAMGIEFARAFDLSAEGIKTAIDRNVKVAFYDRKIFLDIHDARKQLNYMPLKKNATVQFIPSNPLITVIDSGENYMVFHGNRRITHIVPQYFEYDSSLDAIRLVVDGQERKVAFGHMVNVDQSFLVVPEEGYRVNVIGFTKTGQPNESGLTITRTDIHDRFSIDESGWKYRVEVYREDKFSGMVLVNFIGDTKRDTDTAFGNNRLKPIHMAHLEKVRRSPDPTKGHPMPSSGR